MISVGNNKAVICKGDFHPAQLYKGDKKIAGHTVESFEGENGVTLENCYNDKVYEAQIIGENLFDSRQLLQAEGWVENNGEYSGYIGKLFATFHTYGAFNVKIPDNAKRICISFEGKNATKNEGTFHFQIYYTDGTSTVWIGVVNSTEWTEYKVKSTLGKTVESIKCGYGESDTIYLRKIQITATEGYETYEPFLLDATITARGRNSLDVKKRYPDYVNNGGGITYNESVLHKIYSTSMLSEYKENTQYTFTADYEITGSEGNSVYPYVEYTDGTATGFWTAMGGVVTGDKSGKIKVTTSSGKTVKKMFLGYSYTHKVNVSLTDMMLVEGTTAEECEPYIEPQTIPFENGKLTEEIPTFKGTTIIEVESEIPATISGKYKKVEV